MSNKYMCTYIKNFEILFLSLKMSCIRMNIYLFEFYIWNNSSAHEIKEINEFENFDY